MAVNLVVNGVTYPFPSEGDHVWGSTVTNWATAVTNNIPQKTGGNFILTGNINFGTNYGVLAKHFTTSAANASTSGMLRLAYGESVSWRNQANTADLPLTSVGGYLTFDTSIIPRADGAFVANRVMISGASANYGMLTSSVTTTELGYLSGVTSAIQTQLGALNTLANGKIFVGNASNIATAVTLSGAVTITNAGVASLANGSISNVHVNAGAFIALTKLQGLTASRALVSDGDGVITPSAVTATELGYLSGVTSAVQTQLGALQTAMGTLSDSNISSGAAIALVKLAAVTASRALVSSAGGVVSASSVTAIELGYLSGVTSAVQTQLNAKASTASVTALTTGNHSVYCHTPNGMGSSYLAIRRFTTNTVVGTAITYADSATLGASFTINDTGIYAMTYVDYTSAGASTAPIGISINADAGESAASIGLAVSAHVLTWTKSTTGIQTGAHIVKRLTAGDVIRPHSTNGLTANTSDPSVMFSITRIGV